MELVDIIQRLHYLENTIEDLLKIGHRYNTSLCQKLAAEYIENELKKFCPGNIDEKCECLKKLTYEDMQVIEQYCLFYGCEEIVFYLVNKKIPYDALLKEEAIIYVQERLLKDNCRRIASYDSSQSATFKTHIWNVINNLVIDFVRKNFREARQVFRHETDDFDIPSSENMDVEQELIETNITDQQFKGLVKEILSNHSSKDDQEYFSKNDNIRRRLRRNLNLTAKERVFLRTLFLEELNINQVRVMPGFNMGQNEAYKWYRDIMQRLTDAFRAAGLFDELHDLLREHLVKLEVDFEGELENIEIKNILYIKKHNTKSTCCHAKRQNIVSQGHIYKSYQELKKQYPHYFTTVRPNVSVSDDYIEDIQSSSKKNKPCFIKMKYCDVVFEVTPRYQEMLQAVFLAKKTKNIV